MRQRLVAAEIRINEWIAEVEKQRVDYLANHPDVDRFSDWEATWREARRRVQDPSHESLFEPLDELCDRYVTGNEEVRKALRQLLSVSNALFYYPRSASDRLAATGEITWLRRGVVAISISDGRPDLRDAASQLRELGEAARSVGIGPSPVFREVAGISSASSVFGDYESMRDMLDRLAKIDR